VPYRTARELVRNWYGDDLVSNIDESDFTVGTTALLIAKRNGATIWRSITNNGAATIFVSAHSAVAANQGIAIGVGNSLILSAIVDFDLASCDLYAVSSGAGNAVHCINLRLIGSQ
jgi:hypothetical protein